jgi:hypothetical protein
VLCAAVHLDLGLRGRLGTRVRKHLREGSCTTPCGPSEPRPASTSAPCSRRTTPRLVRDTLLCLLGLAVLVLPRLSDRPLLVAACLFALACEVVHAEAWIAAYRTVAARMLRGRFDPARESEVRSPRMRAVLEEVERAQDGDVTVYSGFTPFVGAGHHAGGWSFVLNLCEGKRTLGVGKERSRSRWPTSRPRSAGRWRRSGWTA